MVEEKITEVGIDQDRKLYVCPEKQDFSFIYRAAMEIAWDPSRRALLSPRLGEEPSLALFNRILAAAADEYGVRLKIGAETVWSNVPQSMRSQIEAER
jgi:hypothetical protein